MNIGQVIDKRFEIQDLLGHGGMGEVYRATDTQTGETVAVKALNPEVLERDPALLERFTREGEALRQLNHPNIVHMVAAVEEKGRHYLVMEFVEGGSLKDLLDSRGSLPASEVVKIALEVADAFTRAHHLKIIHRDLKPGNILLARDGTPRLADFGIAHVQESSHLTQTGILVGTVDYLSPEVCQGEPPDELSDIWAFGVLLFEMLSGKLPFEGKSVTAKITAILHQPIPDLNRITPDIPGALSDLIYRMLEKDPLQRISSVRLVGAELEAIQKGKEKTSRTVSSSGMPAFLEKGEDGEPPVFVTRENELAQLDRFLNRALEGHGQVAFVTGDPGQGKTALTQEFARRACDKYPELVIAGGNCNAYTGIGDPYLPFREILGLLCGDIESRWEARAISRDQARRLWECLSLTLQALVESGPYLVETFVHGETLVKRAAAYGTRPLPWVSKLEQLVQARVATPAEPGLQQPALFEQYTRVLRAVARQKPLLLILDDLQWADGASINLLFHLSQRLEGCRIMLLGTYRTAELALGRDGKRHPLEPIVNELKRQFGEIQIEPGKSDGQRFVDGLVNSEPNRLGADFRARLFRAAGGYPLATIELLRDMQERGGLVRDAAGCWVEARTLDWDALPARVEAMIAERIGRLDQQEQQVLQVASVEGETFTAEVVAQVLGQEPQTILRLLSGELDRRHRLVSAQSIRELGGQRLSIYRFQHILFQRYVHGSLDVVERANLHQAVATALKNLYAAGQANLAGQLAHHLQEAGTSAEAAEYLVQAGDRAAEVRAHQEAIGHYQQARKAYEQALGERWDPVERARLEGKIGESYYQCGETGNAQVYLLRALGYLGHTFPTSRTGVWLAIGRELLGQLSLRLLPAISRRPRAGAPTPAVAATIRLCRRQGWILGLSDLERAALMILWSANLAEREGYVAGMALGWGGLGYICDQPGWWRLADYYHQRALAIVEQDREPATAALVYHLLARHEGSRGLWAAAIHHYELASAAYRETADLFGWTVALGSPAALYRLLGDCVSLQPRLREAAQICRDAGDPQALAGALETLADLLVYTGPLGEAVTAVQEAMDLYRGGLTYTSMVSAAGDLGFAYVRLGNLDTAIRVLEENKLIIEKNHYSGQDSTLVRDVLATAYLVAAEQAVDLSRSSWLKKARHACAAALKQGKVDRAGWLRAIRLRARYEWLKGKPEAAQRWWQRGLAEAQRLEAPYEIGMFHLEMGQRLNNRTYLERAETILRQAGATLDWEQARGLLDKLTASPPKPALVGS